MSSIEDLLYEAHELGRRKEVIERVREHQIDCGAQGMPYIQKDAYEKVMNEVRESINKNKTDD
jgi:hypothetical protein